MISGTVSRLARGASDRQELQRKQAALTKRSETPLERSVDTTSAPVIRAYEAKIEKPEHEKLLIAEQLEQIASPRGRFEETFELAWGFLSNPWKTWCSKAMVLNRSVLGLAFAEPMVYERKEGYRTP